VKKHLENLGFVVGGKISVITQTGGNVIVKVKEARVAISSEMAQKIMI
jgi:ferrous iron transport protein A